MKVKYSEQLADGRWLRKKNEILERDNYTCTRCGATSHLDIHHLYYENGKSAWEYPNDALVTLCRACHENEHDIVTYPKIGKIYTFYHGDYYNDMICFRIHQKEDKIFLFGVDSGAYGYPYISIFTLEQFLFKCRNSELRFDVEGEDRCQYVIDSFYFAYKDIMENAGTYIGECYPYTQEQNIAFNLKKINEAISLQCGMVEAFRMCDMAYDNEVIKNYFEPYSL